MPPSHSEIDKLIEDGLHRYAMGDLDGALLVWEEVLALDPENSQAASYVDYVRTNYELLTGIDDAGDGAPFAIASDDPEYQIEIVPGELAAGPAPRAIGSVDEGWLIEDEAGGFATPRTISPPGVTFELEAEEPPSFEDATREYVGQRPGQRAPAPPVPEAASEFEPQVTPGFDGPDAHTPTGGFGAQVTDIKQRDLGFVQPRRDADVPEPRPAPPPELKISLRTPVTQDRPKYMSESIQAIAPPSANAEVELSYSGPSDDAPTGLRPRPAPEDLLAGLPTPKQTSGVITRELPNETRPPARASEPPQNVAPTATRDLEPTQDIQTVKTRDFDQNMTKRLPNLHQLSADTGRATPAPPPDPRVSAPTRDLGLRGQARTTTDDEPTSEADISTLRKRPPKSPDGTDADLILSFDPISARSDEILEAVDAFTPANESKEDRTRRRITALLDHALEWNRGGELDRAVAAVDLALAEDPNSALAQKLIQRNREAIMQVFTGFLGDLERMPVLARPLHELGEAPISPRAAFLLSRIDGTLSLDEILDVSGMPRIEAYRYLCQLFLRGILR